MMYRHLFPLFLPLFLIGTDAFCTHTPPEEEPHTLHFSDSLIISDAQNYLETKIRKTEHHNSTISEELSHRSSEVFTPFTGKVTGMKVRLRLQPNTDGSIIREALPGEFWIITNEFQDFYAVQPKSEAKGYVYRTYVLDGIVEGSHVNLRLLPEMQSPVITQLHQGDALSLSSEQKYPKWVEVKIPENVSFYIAKEYIKRIGPKALYAELELKRTHFLDEFKKIQERAEKELKRPFQEIQLAPIANELKALETKIADFPDVLTYARDLISHIQEQYLQLSVTDHHLSKKFVPIKEAIPEKRPADEKNAGYEAKTTFSLEQQELHIVQKAIEEGRSANEQDFYAQEIARSFTVSGILIPYERTVKNRPGDFILVDVHSKVPLAYIYSTKISLQDILGEHITIQATERPNHFFALPAYYAVQILTHGQEERMKR